MIFGICFPRFSVTWKSAFFSSKNKNKNFLEQKRANLKGTWVKWHFHWNLSQYGAYEINAFENLTDYTRWDNQSDLRSGDFLRNTLPKLDVETVVNCK